MIKCLSQIKGFSFRQNPGVCFSISHWSSCLSTLCWETLGPLADLASFTCAIYLNTSPDLAQTPGNRNSCNTPETSYDHSNILHTATCPVLGNATQQPHSCLLYHFYCDHKPCTGSLFVFAHHASHSSHFISQFLAFSASLTLSTLSAPFLFLLLSTFIYSHSPVPLSLPVFLPLVEFLLWFGGMLNSF